MVLYARVGWGGPWGALREDRGVGKEQGFEGMEGMRREEREERPPTGRSRQGIQGSEGAEDNSFQKKRCEPGWG